MQPIAFALLPNAGFGNKLFVWAHAIAFARLNGLQSYSVGWSYPRIGPILRKERRDILYGRHLRSDGFGRAGGLIKYFLFKRYYEPAISRQRIEANTAYVFNKIPHWGDFFGNVHASREVVIRSFAELARPSFANAVAGCKPSPIAVHVRRGDFRELRADEDFSQVGGVKTPTEYFLNIIKNIRDCAGIELPVMIFTDGTDTEISALIALRNVRRAPTIPDIGHLMLMARSEIIVASAGSTFSMWAGFLSEAALILHPSHIHAPIRPRTLHNELYEGPAVGKWHDWDAILVQKIQSLRRELAK